MQRCLRKYLPFLLSVLLLATACKKKKNDQDPDPIAPYDRGSMLANYGNNLIIPAYQQFGTSLDSLQASVSRFTAAPTAVALDSLQAQTLRAWAEVQWILPFGFGPGETRYSRQIFNTFPADTAQILTNIAAGTWDLNLAANADARGFPAMDFLLFDYAASDSRILNRFTMGSDTTAWRNYLNDIVLDMKSLQAALLSDWTSGGYLGTFTSNTGTEAGTPSSAVVNQLAYTVELVKNLKLGIPLGKKTLGVAQPYKCEGYYSGASRMLAIEQLKALQHFFNGRSRSGTDGAGLDDYLNHVGAMYGGVRLSDEVNNRFNTAITLTSAMPDPLSVNVVSNPTPADNAYQACVQLIVLLKVDVPSALSILITYTDTDGD